jgi:hypothetical protein
MRAPSAGVILATGAIRHMMLPRCSNRVHSSVPVSFGPQTAPSPPPMRVPSPSLVSGGIPG